MKNHLQHPRIVPLIAVVLAPLAVTAIMVAAQIGSAGTPQRAAGSEAQAAQIAATDGAPSTPTEPVNPLRSDPSSKRPAKREPAGGISAPGGHKTAKNSAATITVQTTTDSAEAKVETDPVKVNGTYFEGWPKPDLALVITGRMDGYLEPCGCAGLENQKGGVSRRHTLLKQLEQQNWPLLPVDVGGLVHRFGRQAEIKFAISVEALKTMGYKAVGFGADDLRLSGGELAAAEAGSSIFVAANVDLLGLTPRVKIIEQAGRKIGITSVLGDQYQRAVNNPDVQLTKAADALREVVKQFDDCDLRILLANATLQESKDLAKEFPQFEIVVTADGGDEPPYRAGKIEGTKTRLIELGHKGMYAIVLGYYDDPRQPSRYQRVALDSRFDGTPEMKQLMVNYQSQLEALGWPGLLGERPPTNPRGQAHDKLWGQYAGLKSCKECHPTAYKIWEKTKHAQATAGLAKLNPSRVNDPECISCHATGWNPSEHFRYATGFSSLKETPQLAGNSCENCHGPGAAHVAAENGKNFAAKEELRGVMKLRAADAENQLCNKCHDGDNDPNFSKTPFETYWSKVKHEGKK